MYGIRRFLRIVFFRNTGRRENYKEPPQKKPEFPENVAFGNDEEENWPVVYAITNNQVNPNGGALLTIEGKNFGSVLSSFGEEDREGNAKIEIYFQKWQGEIKDAVFYRTHRNFGTKFR